MYVRIQDVLGQNMTSIDPHNFSYTFDGTNVTSATQSATVGHNEENGTCGAGTWGWQVQWSLSYLEYIGAIGQSALSSHAHAEFNYIGGRFDCPWTGLYYNIIDTKVDGSGSGGPATCAYRFWARNYAFGWQKQTLCWDDVGDATFPGTY